MYSHSHNFITDLKKRRSLLSRLNFLYSFAVSRYLKFVIPSQTVFKVTKSLGTCRADLHNFLVLFLGALHWLCCGRQLPKARMLSGFSSAFISRLTSLSNAA